MPSIFFNKPNNIGYLELVVLRSRKRLTLTESLTWMGTARLQHRARHRQLEHATQALETVITIVPSWWYFMEVGNSRWELGNRGEDEATDTVAFSRALSMLVKAAAARLGT